MGPEEFEVAKWVMGAVFAAGVAYATIYIKESNLARQLKDVEADLLRSENRLDAKIEEIGQELDQHRQETTDRLARIETKIDLLLSEE